PPGPTRRRSGRAARRRWCRRPARPAAGAAARRSRRSPQRPRGRISRRQHGHDLEVGEVGPSRRPRLEQRRVVGLHQLEAAVEPLCHPALDVLEPLGQHPAAVAGPLVHGLRPLREPLDHYVTHRHPRRSSRDRIRAPAVYDRRVTGSVHVTVWGGARRPAPRAVLVHGTMTWGTDEHGFAAQRPLADAAELWVVDRRGFGASPDVDRSDYALDATDVAGLMAGGAHLVGHSYGGVVVMLAAAMRPRDVCSLTLIEPAAHRAAAGDAVVAAALARMRAAISEAPSMTPEEWLRASTEAVGMGPLAPTPARL